MIATATGKRQRGTVLAICIAASMFASAVPARADSPVDWRKVDAVFEEWNRWDSPGAALAVVRDGEIVYSRGYGSAHLEYPIPITPQTVFHVASVSKQFTCFAILLMAAEGKLSLDDDIRKHLTDVPDFGRSITIRHLVHHTSGLRDQWELLAMCGWRLDDVITREHVLKAVARQKELNFDPGSEHLYCNTGYTLLAEIVAKVSGQSFPQFALERIFKPLAMSRTHFHDDHERIVPGRAYSYSKASDGYRNSVLSYANVGATSLFTTAEDLCRWLANLDDGHVGGTDAVKQMHERGTLAGGKTIDYAFGLTHSKHRGLELVGHSGSDAGFRSHAVRVPKHRLGVVVLSNLASFNPGGAANKVIEILLAEHIEPAKEKEKADETPVTVDASILDRYVGLYRLDVGPVVELTRAGRQLAGEIEGATKFSMIARGDKEFFVKELGARVVFEQDGDEPCTGFTAVTEGQTLRGTRVTPKEPADLSALVGAYFSPELDTTYYLEVQDKVLVARHQRNSDIVLHSLGNDEFAGAQWFFSTVRFERQDGKVTAMRVTGGRVRNLRFERR